MIECGIALVCARISLFVLSRLARLSLLSVAVSPNRHFEGWALLHALFFPSLERIVVAPCTKLVAIALAPYEIQFLASGARLIPAL